MGSHAYLHVFYYSITKQAMAYHGLPWLTYENFFHTKIGYSPVSTLLSSTHRNQMITQKYHFENHIIDLYLFIVVNFGLHTNKFTD